MCTFCKMLQHLLVFLSLLFWKLSLTFMCHCDGNYTLNVCTSSCIKFELLVHKYNLAFGAAQYRETNRPTILMDDLHLLLTYADCGQTVLSRVFKHCLKSLLTDQPRQHSLDVWRAAQLGSLKNRTLLWKMFNIPLFTLSLRPLLLGGLCSRGRLRSAQVRQHHTSAHITDGAAVLHQPAGPQHPRLWSHQPNVRTGPTLVSQTLVRVAR